MSFALFVSPATRFDALEEKTTYRPSPLMAGAADALRDALAAVEVRHPRFPVYSNGTAQPFADVRAELVANLLRPVRWRETVLALREAGAEDFVELGPGRVLSGLVKRTLREVVA